MCYTLSKPSQTLNVVIEKWASLKNRRAEMSIHSTKPHDIRCFHLCEYTDVYLSTCLPAFGYFYFCKNNAHATAAQRIAVGKMFSSKLWQHYTSGSFWPSLLFLKGCISTSKGISGEKELAVQLFSPPQEDLQDRFEKYLWSLYPNKYKDNKDSDC